MRSTRMRGRFSRTTFPGRLRDTGTDARFITGWMDYLIGGFFGSTRWMRGGKGVNAISEKGGLEGCLACSVEYPRKGGRNGGG